MSFWAFSQFTLQRYTGWFQLGTDVYIQPGGGWGVPDPPIPNIPLEDPLLEYGSSVNITYWASGNYLDRFIQPRNQNLFQAPSPIPFFGLSLPVSFNTNGYRDSYFDANGILPVVQPAPNPFVNLWLIQIR